MRAVFRLLVWAVVLAGLVGGALYLLVFDVWVVPSDDPVFAASIAPTLAPGDVVLLLRAATMSPGNLVRCPDPDAEGRYVVARAYGRAGDQVVIDREEPSVNGKRTPSSGPCDEPVAVVYDPKAAYDVDLVCSIEERGGTEFDALRSQTSTEPPTNATVEPGKWFLVSDDRHVHLDSRDFGAVGSRGCERVVFRIVGSAGFGDDRTRLSIIW